MERCICMDWWMFILGALPLSEGDHTPFPTRWDPPKFRLFDSPPLKVEGSNESECNISPIGSSPLLIRLHRG
ncbi:hypothetical protein MLD38_003611 [Melastoma candidum]|uniref:Uncharacterized protein n=1 Tax=Melastoma candidum TaxID=119954 RepID=A0ACB9S2M4_9MYRT|nr:hypothetical protein MLD38_003611 [Melastoma candidum]